MGKVLRMTDKNTLDRLGYYMNKAHEACQIKRPVPRVEALSCILEEIEAEFSMQIGKGEEWVDGREDRKAVRNLYILVADIMFHTVESKR